MRATTLWNLQNGPFKAGVPSYNMQKGRPSILVNTYHIACKRQYQLFVINRSARVQYIVGSMT